jgi:hypothetical protein
MPGSLILIDAIMSAIDDYAERDDRRAARDNAPVQGTLGTNRPNP